MGFVLWKSTVCFMIILIRNNNNINQYFKLTHHNKCFLASDGKPVYGKLEGIWSYALGNVSRKNFLFCGNTETNCRNQSECWVL